MSITNKQINDYLGQRSIPHSKLGYKYLMLGIRAMLDGKIDRHRMLSVYEYVANQSGVSVGQVDRAIRGMIRKTPNPVSNKEFLSRAIDDLLLEENPDAVIFDLL